MKFPTNQAPIIGFAGHFMNLSLCTLSDLDPWIDPPQPPDYPQYGQQDLNNIERAIVECEQMRGVAKWEISQSSNRASQYTLEQSQIIKNIQFLHCHISAIFFHTYTTHLVSSNKKL